MADELSGSADVYLLSSIDWGKMMKLKLMISALLLSAGLLNASPAVFDQKTGKLLKPSCGEGWHYKGKPHKKGSGCVLDKPKTNVNSGTNQNPADAAGREVE